MYFNQFKKYSPWVVTYTIREGDTLYSLAQKFNTSVQDIVMYNPGINPYELMIGQVVYIPFTWEHYKNKELNVRFMYPSPWQKVETGPYEPIRYEGETGFFEVTTIVAAPPDNPEDVTPIHEVCQSYAHGPFDPYGTNPSIEMTTIDGQIACLILPSEDQQEQFNNRAAFIIEYKHPIEIDGRDHHYFLLYANKQYIRSIVSTLSFIEK